MKKLPPLKFIPQPKERIWGGYNLKNKLKKPFLGNSIGESWEISTIKNSVSIVSEGVLKGEKLDKLIVDYEYRLIGKSIFEKFGYKFPLLIKFIDAKQDLSVQLHPDDKIAKKHHNSNGKLEMWYIIKSMPDSKISVGFKENISREKYLAYLKKNNLEKILNFKKVKPYDAFLINPGVVHSIGKNILLAEIQQASDITYRIYDYGRKDQKGNERELHINLANRAIKLEKDENYSVKYKPKKNKSVTLTNTEKFITKLIIVDGEIILKLKKIDSFSILICLEGEILYYETKIKKNLHFGETLFLPAEIELIKLKGKKTKILHIHM